MTCPLLLSFPDYRHHFVVNRGMCRDRRGTHGPHVIRQCREQPFIFLLLLRHHVMNIEFHRNTGGSPLSDCDSEIHVIEKSKNTVCNARYVPGFDEIAMFTVADDFLRPIDARPDHRNTAGPRFQVDSWEAFPQRGQDKHIQTTQYF